MDEIKKIVEYLKKNGIESVWLFPECFCENGKKPTDEISISLRVGVFDHEYKVVKYGDLAIIDYVVDWMRRYNFEWVDEKTDWNALKRYYTFINHGVRKVTYYDV